MKRILPGLMLAAVLSWASISHAEPVDPVADLIARWASRIGPALETIGLKATLYITTNRSTGRDSIGCPVIPMRTAAVDGVHVRRHTVLFIKETVGLRMPDGRPHDGFWYATDVGSAIVPGRIDLYTGKGMGSITPLLSLNLHRLTVSTIGHFVGCPTTTGSPLLARTA